jgi:hypothetical protein
VGQWGEPYVGVAFPCLTPMPHSHQMAARQPQEVIDRFTSHIQDHNPDALAMSEHLDNANCRKRCDQGSQVVAIAVPDIFLFDQASSI